MFQHRNIWKHLAQWLSMRINFIISIKSSKITFCLCAQHIKMATAIKGKLVLGKAPRQEDVWRSGGIALPFLTSALHEGEWSASGYCLSVPRGKSIRFPLDKRVNGPQFRSGLHLIKKYLSAGNRTLTIKHYSLPTESLQIMYVY
jgi:hypothetical protein